MYRTNDPRFRRRLNEIGQTVERANEQAQSNIYIFGQNYIRPCFESVGACLTTCVDASCPSLNLTQRDRLRRQRGRGRSQGRAELSFDFYDDWDEDETDGLLGWGNDDFDRLLTGSGGSYGTVSSTQPARQRGMSYPKGRRKSGAQSHDAASDPTVIPGSSFFGKLFGGKALRYRPSAADLQEHPGARRLARDRTEGEALLEDSEPSESGARKTHRRARSGTAGTAGSGETTDSFSSRGDIFPSDGEDDAVPLDDEFAMVLERRTTQSAGDAPETENISNNRPRSSKRGKRPSAGSRTSTRRTHSIRSRGSSTTTGLKGRSRGSSTSAAPPTPSLDDDTPTPPTMSELRREEHGIEQREEAEIGRRRLEAQKLAEGRGLMDTATITDDDPSSKEDATPLAQSPDTAASRPTTSGTDVEEPSQLPTPLPTDDEEEEMAARAVRSSSPSPPSAKSKGSEEEAGR